MADFKLRGQVELAFGNKGSVSEIAAQIRRELGAAIPINLTVSPNKIGDPLQQTKKSAKDLNTELGRGGANFKNSWTGVDSSVRKTQLLIKNLNNDLYKVGRGLKQVQGAADSLDSAGGSQYASNITRDFNKAAANIKKTVNLFDAFVGGVSTRFAQFAKFAIASAGVQKIVQAIDYGFEALVKINDAQIKLKQVTGASNLEIQNFSSNILKLSRDWGVASTDILEGSDILAQAGFNLKQVQSLVKTIALTKLGPSFGGIEKTSEGLIAATAQFKLLKETLAGDVDSRAATKLLSRINDLSKKYAVESGNIIEAIKSAGGVFAAGEGLLDQVTGQFTSANPKIGLDIASKFSAIVTVIRSQTRLSESVIATGLRTIVQRLQDAKVNEGLQEVIGGNFDLRDSEGQFIGVYNALKLISREFEGVSTQSQEFARAVDLIGGGVRQSKIAIPLIKAFKEIAEAYETSKQATDSITQDAIIAQEGLSTKLTKIGQELATFGTKIAESTGFKEFLDTVNDTIKAVTKLLELFKPTIQFGAFAGIASILAPKGISALSSLLPGKTSTYIDRDRLSSIPALDNVPTGFKPTFQGSILDDVFRAVRNRYQPLGDPQPRRRFMYGGKAFGNQTIDALLTPGEIVIPPDQVRQIGVSKLEAINRQGLSGIDSVPVKLSEGSYVLNKNIGRERFDKQYGSFLGKLGIFYSPEVANKKQQVGIYGSANNIIGINSKAKRPRVTGLHELIHGLGIDDEALKLKNYDKYYGKFLAKYSSRYLKTRNIDISPNQIFDMSEGNSKVMTSVLQSITGYGGLLKEGAPTAIETSGARLRDLYKLINRPGAPTETKNIIREAWSLSGNKQDFERELGYTKIGKNILYNRNLVKQVLKTKLPGFNKGGFIGTVPGSGNTDSFRASLAPGSFVLNKKSSNMLRSGALKFAKGGGVPDPYKDPAGFLRNISNIGISYSGTQQQPGIQQDPQYQAAQKEEEQALKDIAKKRKQQARFVAESTAAEAKLSDLRKQQQQQMRVISSSYSELRKTTTALAQASKEEERLKRSLNVGPQSESTGRSWLGRQARRYFPSMTQLQRGQTQTALESQSAKVQDLRKLAIEQARTVKANIEKTSFAGQLNPVTGSYYKSTGSISTPMVSRMDTRAKFRNAQGAFINSEEAILNSASEGKPIFGKRGILGKYKDYTLDAARATARRFRGQRDSTLGQSYIGVERQGPTGLGFALSRLREVQVRESGIQGPQSNLLAARNTKNLLQLKAAQSQSNYNIPQAFANARDSYEGRKLSSLYNNVEDKIVPQRILGKVGFGASTNFLDAQLLQGTTPNKRQQYNTGFLGFGSGVALNATLDRNGADGGLMRNYTLGAGIVSPNSPGYGLSENQQSFAIAKGIISDKAVSKKNIQMVGGEGAAVKILASSKKYQTTLDKFSASLTKTQQQALNKYYDGLLLNASKLKLNALELSKQREALTRQIAVTTTGSKEQQALIKQRRELSPKVDEAIKKSQTAESRVSPLMQRMVKIINPEVAAQYKTLKTESRDILKKEADRAELTKLSTGNLSTVSGGLRVNRGKLNLEQQARFDQLQARAGVKDNSTNIYEKNRLFQKASISQNLFANKSSDSLFKEIQKADPTAVKSQDELNKMLKSKDGVMLLASTFPKLEKAINQTAQAVQKAEKFETKRAQAVTKLDKLTVGNKNFDANLSKSLIRSEAFKNDGFSGTSLLTKGSLRAGSPELESLTKKPMSLKQVPGAVGGFIGNAAVGLGKAGVRTLIGEKLNIKNIDKQIRSIDSSIASADPDNRKSLEERRSDLTSRRSDIIQQARERRAIRTQRIGTAGMGLAFVGGSMAMSEDEATAKRGRLLSNIGGGMAVGAQFGGAYGALAGAGYGFYQAKQDERTAEERRLRGEAQGTSLRNFDANIRTGEFSRLQSNLDAFSGSSIKIDPFKDTEDQSWYNPSLVAGQVGNTFSNILDGKIWDKDTTLGAETTAAYNEKRRSQNFDNFRKKSDERSKSYLDQLGQVAEQSLQNSTPTLKRISQSTADRDQMLLARNEVKSLGGLEGVVLGIEDEVAALEYKASQLAPGQSLSKEEQKDLADAKAKLSGMKSITYKNAAGIEETTNITSKDLKRSFEENRYKNLNAQVAKGEKERLALIDIQAQNEFKNAFTEDENKAFLSFADYKRRQDPNLTDSEIFKQFTESTDERKASFEKAKAKANKSVSRKLELTTNAENYNEQSNRYYESLNSTSRRAGAYFSALGENNRLNISSMQDLSASRTTGAISKFGRATPIAQILANRSGYDNLGVSDGRTASRVAEDRFNQVFGRNSTVGKANRLGGAYQRLSSNFTDMVEGNMKNGSTTIEDASFKALREFGKNNRLSGSESFKQIEREFQALIDSTANLTDEGLKSGLSSNDFQATIDKIAAPLNESVAQAAQALDELTAQQIDAVNQYASQSVSNKRADFQRRTGVAQNFLEQFGAMRGDNAVQQAERRARFSRIEVENLAGTSNAQDIIARREQVRGELSSLDASDPKFAKLAEESVRLTEALKMLSENTDQAALAMAQIEEENRQRGVKRNKLVDFLTGGKEDKEAFMRQEQARAALESGKIDYSRLTERDLGDIRGAIEYQREIDPKKAEELEKNLINAAVKPMEAGLTNAYMKGQVKLGDLTADQRGSIRKELVRTGKDRAVDKFDERVAKGKFEVNEKGITFSGTAVSDLAQTNPEFLKDREKQVMEGLTNQNDAALAIKSDESAALGDLQGILRGIENSMKGLGNLDFSKVNFKPIEDAAKTIERAANTIANASITVQGDVNVKQAAGANFDRINDFHSSVQQTVTKAVHDNNDKINDLVRNIVNDALLSLRDSTNSVGANIAGLQNGQGLQTLEYKKI
jgi:uncharacterized protein YdcH (DUF465 family)